MARAVLALDQGTTGSTALVLTADGRVIARAYSEFTQSYPQPGWVEHDPEEIWRVSLEVVGEALNEAALGAGDLAAIGVVNQRETTVLWDRATGRPIYPAIVWQSRQTAEVCERLERQGARAVVQARTGLVIDPYFSATKIAWILDRQPEARAMARDGRVVFGTIDTWLLWKMTGGAVHATDPTNASRTLLYDIHERRWHPELLDLFEVPEAMLPAVLPSCGAFGESTAQGRLPGGVPVTGVAGDQQAALYGQQCWDAGMAKNTYGTGCFVVMNMGERGPTSRHGLLTTICCNAHGQPAYALEGSIFVAGAAVQWLRDQLGLIRSASETEAIASSLADTGGVYVVPAFVGLGAPYWDMRARGAIVGLTRGTGRAEIVRATLESLAYQTRDVVEAMNADSGVPLTELRVDGGAAANGFLMQFQADLLGVPVDRPAVLESTAVGAGLLAGLGVGLWKGPEAIKDVMLRDRRFEPRMHADDRERLYSGWKRAVAQVRTSAPSASD